MEVAELYHLAEWFQKHGAVVVKKYQALMKIMEANLTPNNQNQAQPIRDTWHDLVDELKKMPLTELNFQQLQHLDELEVAQYIGDVGASYVRRTVKESSYDPATGVEGIKSAHGAVNSAVQQFKAVQQSLDAVRLVPQDVSEYIDEDEEALARIQFTSDASITNIAELKKWSNDWNDIVRGVGLCVGETPHNVRVLGASRGSIILSVGGTIAFVSFLAIMSRKVADIVLSGMQVANAIEDFRHKKVMNQTIETAIRDEQKAKEAKAEDDLVEELKQRAVGFEPEHEGHLRTAVRKFIQFSKKGGVVDYIEPPRDEVEEEADGEEGQEAGQAATGLTQELRALISEIRTMKAETYLIEHKTLDDEDPDDDEDEANEEPE